MNDTPHSSTPPPPDPAPQQHAFVALGSNLGDRLSYLRFAVHALRDDPQITVLGSSPVYESVAHSLDPSIPQPSFLNAVVKLSTSLAPEVLLERLLNTERQAGRQRDRRWAPRTLDLDLLIFGMEVIRSGGLVVPHPRLRERRFVLRPLADLDPDLHVPAPYDQSVAALLETCPDTHRPVRTALTL